MHIVIADGSSIILKHAQELLTKQGYTVNAFTDGQLALDFIASHEDVDLLITGLELKTMPGMELIWNVKVDIQRSNPIFVIAMSSSTEKKAMAQALDSGADDFFSKPVDKIELFARVRSAQRVLAMQKRLVRMATRDALTGLLNRGAFLTKANLAVSDSKNRPATLVMIDIDHFKKINDQYGHVTGDLVLRSVAELLRQSDDFVGRIGGEEFAILLEKRDKAQAKLEMEILRSSIENAVISTDDYTVKCTCSFGIAVVSADETTIERAYLQADHALYSSKNGGRNLVTIYEEDQLEGA